MNASLYDIPALNLCWALSLVAAVVIIYVKWSLDYKNILYASLRMVMQLLAIGFVLVYLFEWRSPYLIMVVLFFMLMAAAWIALRPIASKRKNLFLKAFASLAVGGIISLSVVVVLVIRPDEWYEPRYLIPIAGMIFSNGMTAISLAAERFESDIERGLDYLETRRNALKISLIPILNSFFAVGLVSLPGMMTGQILAGVSPLVAVRYQIMVMCMLLGAAGISSALYIHWMKSSYTEGAET